MSIVKELSTDPKTLEELLQPAAPPQPGAKPGPPPAVEAARRKLELLLKVPESLSNPEASEDLPDLIVKLLPQILAVQRAVLVMPGADGQLDGVASHSTVPVESPAMFSRQIASYVMEKAVAVLSLDAKTDVRFE